MVTKICSKCGEQFPATPEFFHKDLRCSHGVTAPCKKCRRKKSREWRDKNRERVQASNKKWGEKNRERKLANGREWRKANAEKIKEYRTKGAYGLTLKEYREFFARRGNKCEVCFTTEALCLDHDPALRRNRGVLCNSCNVSLGYLKENVQIIRRLAAHAVRIGGA